MPVEFSTIGRRLALGSGIGALMEDLGKALVSSSAELCMLGGGQPALIPEAEALWRRRTEELMGREDGLQRMLSIYEPPSGNPRFRQAVAGMCSQEFGWRLGEQNIAVTPGGQCAFFLLFNLLAGEMPDGANRRILFPLMPEYIGYADQGMQPDLFIGLPPLIEEIGEREFKYHIDFDAVEQAAANEPIGAICVSRPTNPSGNVLTDAEVGRLRELAKRLDVPLIIDNAYGAPFPGILFREVTPTWDDGIILTLSLSKVGLPGTRTGIVIASPEITAALSSMTAIVGLANNNVGQAIAAPLIESGELLELARQHVQPFYLAKRDEALAVFHRALPGHIPWRLHAAEGALFLWLWIPGLPISSKELYRRLKARDVLVIPGEYFFFGLADPDWRHCHECIRISYAMDHDTVERGAKTIGAELRAIFESSTAA
jgi:valine--pyruvate aminotransferase